MQMAKICHHRKEENLSSNFAGNHFTNKNAQMPLQITSAEKLKYSKYCILKKNYAKMSYQHLHKTHMLSGIQYTLHNITSPLVGFIFQSLHVCMNTFMNTHLMAEQPQEPRKCFDSRYQ